MTELMICHGCIGDEILSAEVRVSGTKSRCHHCERHRKGWSLRKLADRIHPVLQANYEPVYPGPYDRYMFEPGGDDPAFVITEMAGLDDTTIGESIQAILSERYGYNAQRDGGMDPYGDEVNYRFAEPDLGYLHLSWTSFRDLLLTRSRFFNSRAQSMLDDIFADLEDLDAGRGRPVIRRFSATRPTLFYRGRVATDKPTLSAILADPVRQLAAPPHALARAGRMNARGISLFYGALDPQTCLAELRPPVGSHVVVTAFQNVRSLRLLDLGRLRSISTGASMFAPNFRERSELAGFLGQLVAELSRPIMPGSEELDYLPTQAVAEYLAGREDLELDGILFPSSQRIHGELNVVLFHDASHATGRVMPTGSHVSMSGPDKDENGDPEDVYVWITPPPKKRDRQKARRDTSLDQLLGPIPAIRHRRSQAADGSVPTLKWVENSLEIFAIKEIDYSRDRHLVRRCIEHRRKLPKF